jgi:DNA-binding beta-propeller fold protein YncE
MVVPGFPEWSHLLWQVNRYPELGPKSEPIMPPPRPDSSNLLSQQEVRLLKDWIAAGAPNQAGKQPYAHMTTTTHRKVFICNAGSDLIAVLHADTYQLMTYIAVGVSPIVIESPHYIQLSPDQRYLYVTLINGSAVEKYRTDTYEKVGRVEVGAEPAHIEFSSDGRYAVITHFTDAAPVKLTLVDAERMQVLDELRDPSGLIIARPHGLWMTSDFRYAYVTANAGNYLTKVEISLDRQRFVDFTQIPIGPGMVPQTTSAWGPYQVVAPPNSPYYFVSCDASHEVRVFEKATDAHIATLPVATAPKLMAYDGDLLYVACLKAESVPLQSSKRGAIAVIDRRTLRVLTHIYNTGHLPRGIGVDPVQRRLWLSFENLAGVDPPHHYVGGLSGAPAKAYVLDIPTFRTEAIREMALVGYGLAVSH